MSDSDLPNKQKSEDLKALCLYELHKNDYNYYKTSKQMGVARSTLKKWYDKGGEKIIKGIVEALGDKQTYEKKAIITQAVKEAKETTPPKRPKPPPGTKRYKIPGAFLKPFAPTGAISHSTSPNRVTLIAYAEEAFRQTLGTCLKLSNESNDLEASTKFFNVLSGFLKESNDKAAPDKKQLPESTQGEFMKIVSDHIDKQKKKKTNEKAG